MKVYLILILAAAWSQSCNGNISLRHMSTVYLPYQYQPSLQFKYNKDVAEQSAYDADKKVVYTVGNDLLHVVDLQNPRNPEIVFYTTIPDGELTDIETCGGFVAMAYDNEVNPLEGKVYVYSGYDSLTMSMHKIHEITVGALPDMLKFTNDCRKIVVALEGELRVHQGKVVDPEGGVAIISFPYGIEEHYQLNVLNFTHFNHRADEYMEKGVRWVFRGEQTDMTTTFSQDLEPEYVTISADETRAYIVLEENNAIAEVDLLNEEITEIHSLGHKSWHGKFIDISDKDGGINMTTWPIYGLFQPDTLKYVTINGENYIFTANEGEEKEYEAPDYPMEWTDGKKGKQFVEEGLLHPSIPEDLREALSDERKLGRLRLSSLDGKEADGRHSKLFTYGGRSFSIWRASDLSLVYDSGDEMEQRISQLLPHVFSADGSALKKTPEQSSDSRSHKKGPETETLDVGVVNGKTVLFVANERPGIIMTYTFEENNVTRPTFQSIHYAGGSGLSWEELHQKRLTRDVDPEDIRFIPAEQSPNGQPILIVSGTTSGTLSFYQVHDSDAPHVTTEDKLHLFQRCVSIEEQLNLPEQDMQIQPIRALSTTVLAQ